MKGHAPRWLPTWERAHRRALTLSSFGLAACAAMLPEPAAPVQLALLLVGVAVLALPHGAVDPFTTGSRFVRARGRQGLLQFVGLYLALACGVVLAWREAPVEALLGFLALSVWHFGRAELDDDPRGSLDTGLETFVRGGVPVLGPLLLRPDETYAWFELLVADASLGPASRSALSLSTWAWVAAGMCWTLRPLRGLDRRALRTTAARVVESAGWLALFAALPVLLAFGFAFCCGHSVRHSLQTASRFDPRSASAALRRFALLALPATVASWALAALAWWGWLRAGSPEAIAQLVFIGLAALTLPHVLLATGRRRAQPRLRPRLALSVLASTAGSGGRTRR